MISFSEEAVKQLWGHFRQGDDHGAGIQFEKFLEGIAKNFQGQQSEKVNMEEFIRNQNETRDEQVTFRNLLISW